MRLNFCPLGACALAGTGLPIDRFMTSSALGFTAPLRNRYQLKWFCHIDFVKQFILECGSKEIHVLYVFM